MTGAPDPDEPAPEAERSPARSEEQEVAGGRTASTPFAVLGSVIFVVACAVGIVVALVVIAILIA